MKTSKYLCYVGVLVIGMALILNYMRFYVCYKELSNTDDSFIYIYTDSDLSEEIVEECQKYQIDCEIWKTGEDENEDSSIKNKENILENKISIAMVKGIEALDYHETENLFLDSDFIIDVNLLKWMVYIIIFSAFFCIMVFYFCQNKKCGNTKWFYVVVMPICFLYVRIFIFVDIEDFPVWSLPEKWSDLEGWGKLGEEVLKQISYIIFFKDYPIICKYYEGVIKSIFYLILSLISLFCARIERKNLRISFIIKENLYPQSTICVDKEVSHGMGSQIKPEHELY